ncbi:universal stress protein [Corynebacterium sp. 320]|uniref:Universal stress protein n=1 Tax=Corynebacterium zhongnanshanii TaxID=2768834 RepID=A0ABQ6VC87_9CORY|nr:MULTISPECIES: universal stress protein [Corynebacterium]KAB1502778.1 universal stress protein [Corynebacterium sp. 320]KAB1550481.1 universal stress protein [Corynebacterium sp. 319]KAB1554788.1 universal stress protein [Corynebacterium sp. 321]KAB3519202.1 universal stress protein [Corynebacterium zhongnanshanii]KAB3526441.1 universal stress protein [Corynebacterium sp. 250]
MSKHSSQPSAHSAAESTRQRRPLRVLMTWRPDSPGDESAQVVAWLARTEQLSVRSATVISRTWSEQPGSQEHTAYQRWLSKETQACADASARALHDAGLPGSMVDAETPAMVSVDHSETQQLITSAKDFGADAMVIGSHPSAPRGQFRIGSTADALLHCSPYPLLLAPKAPRLSKRGVTRVNCCYVDTDQSHQALRNAADLAARWNVPLRLVAFTPRGATMYPTQVRFDSSSDMMVEWREQALALLDRGRDRALARHSHLTVETATGSGYGWSGAINALKWKKGDLLVMGSSTLGEFNRVFIGPSTNQILRHSQVPVLISPV